jgi:hypothetical protein
MKYALMLLCVLGSLLGLFVGGCTAVVALSDGGGFTSGLDVLLLSLVIGLPGILIMVVNVAIIDALRRGQTERRGPFAVLAILDLLVAWVVTSIGNGADPTPGLLLGVPLGLKGVLTFLLFRAGNPPQAPVESPAQSGGPPS